ncbi:putative polycystic kidney disease protein 1-like 2-like [Penaeus vannamei]|uniref:Putative polycystic kidney disease protein 1-like 2-like n=1 Tax=Penaeus vannamei TaxID=6689 RepID=A0A423SJ33_PENVA|nr:putative polycystic kidney disease protein 1-like 2-like [Penaeus vannamei]
MRGMIKRCSGFSNVFKEDDEAYCAHWKPPTNLTKDSPDCKIPEFKFTGIRLLPHHDSFGLFVMVCEASFVAFIIYYTFREFRQLCRNKVEYFKCYWSYAEIAIIVTSYATIAVYVASRSSSLQPHPRKRIREPPVRGFPGRTLLLPGVLTATLRQCWDDLSGFLIAFIICFCSFTGMFYLLLNSQLENFHNFVISVETCFSMMLGKFQFEEMKQASSVVPVMFFIFVLSNSWVLLNLLLTVIIRSFEQVGGHGDRVVKCNIFILTTCDHIPSTPAKTQHTYTHHIPSTPQPTHHIPSTYPQPQVNATYNHHMPHHIPSTPGHTLITRLTTYPQPQVKHDIMQQPTDYMMVSFIMGRIRGFFGMQKPPPPPPVTMATPSSPSEAPPTREEGEGKGAFNSKVGPKPRPIQLAQGIGEVRAGTQKSKRHPGFLR